MPEAPGWLLGRVAIVTGAGRGIGRATAEALARAGAHVVLAARTESHLNNVAETIRKKGGAATVAPTDVGDGGDVNRLFAIADRVGIFENLLGVARGTFIIAFSGIAGPRRSVLRTGLCT